MRNEDIWRRLEGLAERLGQRLDAFVTDGDAQAVLDPAAVTEAEELSQAALVTPDGPTEPVHVLDRDLLRGLAQLFHARCTLHRTETPETVEELGFAVMLYAVLGRIAPEEVPQEAQELIAGMKVPAVRELGPETNRALESFVRWQAGGDPAALAEAISVWRTAVEILPGWFNGRAMMLSNLGSALRFRFTVQGTLPDLEEAVVLGREAVRAAHPGDPALCLYLANLSGALSLHHGFAGRDPAVLDEAVETGAEAVRVAPEPHSLFHSNAGIALLMRYETTSDPADPDRAAEQFGLAVRRAERTDPQRPLYLSNLARALHQRYGRHHRAADLDGAADAAREAVDGCPPGHPLRASALSALGDILRSRANRTGASADLDAAVGTGRQALDAVPAAHADRDGVAERLALALRDRFGHTGRRADIDEAVTLLGDQVREGSPPELFFNLCSVLLARFHATEDPADADAAIDAARRGLGGVAAGTAHRGLLLGGLGEALRRRSQRTGSAEDIEAAVEALREARALLTGFHPTAVAKCLSELGLALGRRHLLTGDPAALDEAVDVFREAVRHPTGTPEQVVDESHLAGTLLLRHGVTGADGDLDESVRLSRGALERLPDESGPHAAQVLFNLGRALQAVHQRDGGLAPLDEAVRRLEGALRAGRATGSPRYSDAGHALHLSNLGAVLRVRAERLGDRADLDRAVELSLQAVDALPAGHPDRATYLTNVCTALTVRYTWAGDQRDLTEAVRTAREAVAGTAAAETGALVVHLTNLGSVLRRRHEWSGALADLDESVEAHRAAVAALPPAHVDAALHHGNLAVAFMSRYERAEDAADLDAAIRAARAAADGVGDEHPQRPNHLSNLGRALGHRYESQGTPGDADEAVDRLRHAVRLCPAGHPQRSFYLVNLVTALLARSGGIDPRTPRDDAAAEDVARAALAARAALRAVPGDHPQRQMCLSALGVALVLRATLDPDEETAEADRQLAYDLLREATTVTVAPSFGRFRTAVAWARAASLNGDWTDSLDAHRAAVAELPLMAWHGLDRRDRLDALGSAAGLAGEAAAAALNCGRLQEALRLLEQGRGVLLAQALDARDEMAELRERAPEAATRIREIRALLEHPGAQATSPEHRDRTAELARELDELTARVRELPGLEDFLRPPSLERLRTAAAHGPVVIVNTSFLRCDALIVTADDVHAVPLPGLGLTGDDGLAERTGALLEALAAAGRSAADTWRARQLLTRTLAWLWDTVAGPVTEALARLDAGERLWWCPTGLLSLLPLHAAGHYDEDGDRNLPDRYVCSYTTTLRALAAGNSAAADEEEDGRLLAVDQSDTPGLPPLPHARQEIEDLTSALGGAATVLAGATATRERLLSALPAHPCLHFSGHGTQDPTDSAGGALYLHDHATAGPLTVADISRLRLRRARLAYLSACETARGAAVLPDEAVHLAGALQLAGFTHVVAAQWVVDDARATQVAETFYGGLRSGPALAPDRAAHALHEAVGRLRRQPDAHPLWWAAFVHTGP
ncbi:CHAT domain-containing protein [Streptomyces sp. NPDC090106]|uniref:CHAT domain-containing protein n=1 Tax=Streptomyces sp. NPDC090106 TaxID=3365946 RepID=UPI0038179F91